MTNRTPRPPKLSDLVVRQLATGILREEIPVGDLLPKEPELCQQFGFSRTVVREALGMLEAKGLVTIEHGRGTRVNPVDLWDSLDPLMVQLRHENGLLQPVLDELLEVRRLVEAEIAALAARRAGRDHIATMEAAIVAMARSDGRVDAYTAADLEFHRTLARASGNGLLSGMLAPIAELLRIGVHVGAAGRDLRRSVEIHHAILEAVASGDELAARAAMGAVVDEFERNIRHVYPAAGAVTRAGYVIDLATNATASH